MARDTFNPNSDTLGGSVSSGPSSGFTNLEVFGHSHPGAGGTFRGSHEGYVDKVAQALGVRRRNNYALGGSISCWPQSSAAGDGGYAWLLQSLPRDNNSNPVSPGRPYVPRSQLVIDHAYVHDLARLGSQNPRPALEACRTKRSRICAASVYEADPSLAWDPNWSFSGNPSAPIGLTATPSTTGGTLAANTYYYKISAINASGEGGASTEVSAVTTGTTSKVALAWTAVPGATSYRIYRGTATNAENVYYTSATNSYSDTGAASTAGTPTGTTSWNDFASIGANSGTGLRYTTTIGDSATFTVPADRRDQHVVAIGLFLNGAHDLTVGVSIDNGAETLVRLQASVLTEQSVSSSKNLSVVLRFGRDSEGVGLAPNSPLDFPTKLPGGVAHTIKLTLRTQTVATSMLAFDYAQIEADPLDGPLIIHPGELRPLSYTPWTGWAHGPDAGTDPINDSKIPIWNTTMATVDTEFPNRIIRVDVDSIINKNPAYFSSDQIHHNPEGHSKIAEAIVKAVKQSPLVTDRILTSASPRLMPFWDPVGMTGRTQFLNGWVNFGATSICGAYRSLDGMMHVQIEAKGGANNTIVFNLPVGCRPRQNLYFAGLSWNGGSYVANNGVVYSTGDIAFLLNGNSSGSFMTVSFPVDV